MQLVISQLAESKHPTGWQCAATETHSSLICVLSSLSSFCFFTCNFTVGVVGTLKAHWHVNHHVVEGVRLSVAPLHQLNGVFAIAFTLIYMAHIPPLMYG